MIENIDAPCAQYSNLDKNRLNFSDLGLAPALQTAVADMGLANPTPVQREAIPHVLQGRALRLRVHQLQYFVVSQVLR